MVDRQRVVVVGAGIGGLSAAIALRSAGFDAQVFEQSAELGEAGAGVGLWSNAMQSLEELGVGDAVRRTCRPNRVVAGGNPEGRQLSRIELDTLGEEFASAACYVVLRPVLLAALVERVPASTVHTKCRAKRVEGLEGGVRIIFENGRVEEAALVVGADGLHSVVRPHVVGEHGIRYSGQTCFRGVACIPPRQPGVLQEVQGRGKRAGICPVDDATVYWWTAHNAPEGQLVPPRDRKALLLEQYRGWPFGLESSIAATPEDAILQNDLVDRAPAGPYVRGRLVLLGDAAHPTTPNLGQGANMAIDDAIALARALRTASTLSAGLRRYEQERLGRTQDIVKRSWAFGQMCLWESSVAVWLREAAVRSTPKSVMRKVLREQILESVGPLVDPALQPSIRPPRERATMRSPS
ncbi:MAG: FAD-dependent monooxygenase [Polyangiaceae bacterium]|nr:FAD-dependent monooxygenase [Polyangiaceae bacterium]